MAFTLSTATVSPHGKHDLSTHSLVHVFEQLPGFVAWKDIDSIYQGANKACLSLLGYDKPQDLCGASDFDLNCEASRSAKCFQEQDRKAMSGKELLTLDVHQYATGPKVLLTRKVSLKDQDQNIIGTIFHGTEINNHSMVGLGVLLNQTNIDNMGKPTSYTLNHYDEQFHLTKREKECIFLLLRGKTARTIGEILGISRRTVEFYLGTIKTKLDCDTKEQLIEKALALGYLYLIPENINLLNLSIILSE